MNSPINDILTNTSLILGLEKISLTVLKSEF